MIKRETIDAFEKTQAQMEALHREIAALSRKSPNDGVNIFKLGLINKVVHTTNQLLGETYRPFADFDSFDENNLPTVSDVAMVLAQYLNCLEKYRADNVHVYQGYWCWCTGAGEDCIRTAQPKKLEGK